MSLAKRTQNVRRQAQEAVGSGLFRTRPTSIAHRPRALRIGGLCGSQPGLGGSVCGVLRARWDCIEPVRPLHPSSLAGVSGGIAHSFACSQEQSRWGPRDCASDGIFERAGGLSVREQDTLTEYATPASGVLDARQAGLTRVASSPRRPQDAARRLAAAGVWARLGGVERVEGRTRLTRRSGGSRAGPSGVGRSHMSRRANVERATRGFART